MKAIITIVFVLFIGIAAQAQNAQEVKVETIQMEMVEITKIDVNKKQIGSNEVARLYRRPNARVKKALSFSTKRDRGIA
jgi:hypothetical protein